MERTLDVFVRVADADHRVGTLWTRARGRESASFEYARTWLDDAEAFALDPELPLAAGRFHTERALFNAFSDPSPDRWGQTLLRRHERARARAEGRAPRTLLAVDFLALVDDTTRLGALRLREPGAETFLTAGGRVPPMVQLPRLLRASAAVIADQDSDDDLALLLAPGTSLGGARPKASVTTSDGRLGIAKFPSRDDDWPVTRWEAAVLAMAAAAGIDVPLRQLVTALGKPVLVIDRFDRRGDARVPYMSALTALGARDGEVRSYLELADTLRILSTAPKRELEQLWRRIAFNVLVSNTDDHLRNHGLLRTGRGWSLAPAFDLNPTPVDVRPRIHALAIDEADQQASIELVRSVAPAFGVAPRGAKAVLAEVAAVVARWRTFGAEHGITKRQLERMESAFEHADLAAARGGSKA